MPDRSRRAFDQAEVLDEVIRRRAPSAAGLRPRNSLVVMGAAEREVRTFPSAIR
jgi:hypothetical protein